MTSILRFKRLPRQQSVHITVAHDQPRDSEARLLDKSRTEMHVVPQIVHTQLQIIQGQLGRVTAELRRLDLLRGAPEFEDRNTWHRWRSRLATAAALNCSPRRGTAGSLTSPPPRRERAGPCGCHSVLPRKRLIFLPMRERSICGY